MTTTTAYPASPAQQKFLADLLAKRAVPENIANQIKTGGMLTSRQASAYIDLLKGFSYLPKTPTFVAGSLTADYKAALEEVPNGRYALPVESLRVAFPTISLTGDFLFLEVRSFKGVRYLRRLTGGGDDGSFIRTRLPLAESIALLNLMSLHAVEFIQNFGRVNACCGRCGKSLTDPESRRLFVGPECRKALGL